MVTFVYEQKVGDIIRLNNNSALTILSTSHDKVNIGLKTSYNEEAANPSSHTTLELKIVNNLQESQQKANLGAPRFDGGLDIMDDSEPPLDGIGR